MESVLTNSLGNSNDLETDASQTWLSLDEPEEWENFSTTLNANQQWESHLAVEGMHCAACALSVEKAVCALPGVISAEVNAASGRARLVWAADIIKPSRWMAAISQAGYRALPAVDALLQNDRRKQQRLMLWRLLVAGFCMMQVMMYSLPVYQASPGEMTASTLNLLRWASWVLTLPVMLFSSGPFFKTAFADIKRRQVSMDLPVSLGISIAFLVSTAATFDPTGWWGNEVYFDSLTMLVFFLLGGRWLELRMRNKTAGALDVLMRRLPSTVERRDADGQFTRVTLRRIKAGDIVRVLPGEAFPADGAVIKGETSANEALLTGESTPVAKTEGAEVIAGSYNLLSAVEVRVKKLGQSTQYAQIVSLMERAAVDKPRLAKLADRIAQPFLILVLLAAAMTAFYLWHVEPSRALMTATAVLIVTCPCALSLATPAAMLTISGALARSGILVRKMQALEALTHVDTVVFDKTGTLTEDKMTVNDIKVETKLTKEQTLQLASEMATYSLHPVSRALVAAAEGQGIPQDAALVTHVKEISGSGLQAESAFGTVKLGHAAFCGLDEVEQAYSTVYLANEAGLLARFNIEESVKPDATEAVSALREAGLQVEVLSGDQRQAVQRVAKRIGVQTAFGGYSPKEKLKHMQALQQEGKKVLMVGDGLNDGPVLASAYASIAMGKAVPLAQSQSDFVILGGQLAMVTNLMQQAKRTMRVVKQNLTWAASYNAVCVPLAIAGYLPAWLAGLGMALSSLLVVLNAARLSRQTTTKAS